MIETIGQDLIEVVNHLEEENKRYREELESLHKHAGELADKDILMSPTAVEKSIEKALEADK